jgi:hypothetical protein
MADHAIKTNARGTSKLLLNYPLELRLRCKQMAQATQQPEQEVIRSGIEQIVSAWESSQKSANIFAGNPEQPVKKTRRTRTSRTGSAASPRNKPRDPKTAKGGA